MVPSLERVCVVIARTRHRMAIAEIQEAARLGARLIELRIDFISRALDLRRLLEKKPCALVATIRRHQDGGRWSGTEEARQTLLRQCIVGGFDWIDLEHEARGNIKRFRPGKQIVRYPKTTGVTDEPEAHS